MKAIGEIFKDTDLFTLLVCLIFLPVVKMLDRDTRDQESQNQVGAF